MNELTGLPELPENHLWRVKSNMPTFDEVRYQPYPGNRVVPRKGYVIQIVEKLTLILPVYRRWWQKDTGATTKVQRDHVVEDCYFSELTPEGVLEAAELAKKKLQSRKLLGDYPPKKLES